MGDERAETYLRLRAEAELRRVSAELRRADAAAGAPADPSTMPFGAAEMAYWKVLRAGGHQSGGSAGLRFTCTACEWGCR